MKNLNQNPAYIVQKIIIVAKRRLLFKFKIKNIGEELRKYQLSYLKIEYVPHDI